MPKIKSPEEISATAFERFQELMADMGWDDDWAIRELMQELAEPQKITKKAVEQWFNRRTVPAAQIFNLGEVLGIRPGWLTDQGDVTKDMAILPGGLYEREVGRENRHRRRRA